MDQLVIITDPSAAGEKVEKVDKCLLNLSRNELDEFPRLGIIEPPTPGVNTPLTPYAGRLGHRNPISNASTFALQIPSSDSPRSPVDDLTALDPTVVVQEAKGANQVTPKIASPISRSSSRERTHRRTSSHEVKETLGAFSSHNEDGIRTVNQYLLKGLIGKGGYARVELATDRETGVSYVSLPFILEFFPFFSRISINRWRKQAVKEFSKSRLRKIAATDALRKGGVNARGRGRLGPTRLPHNPPPAHTLSFDEQGLDNLNLIRTEVAILKKLNHPAICSIHEVIDINSDEGNDSIMIVMELCPGGTIDKAYQVPMEEEVARGIFRQLTLGIAYLHANCIIHRDVKPDNVLFLQDKSTIRCVPFHSLVDGLKLTFCTSRIVDFGVSTMFTKVQDDSVGRAVGTPAFMAPELCSTSQYSPQQSRKRNIDNSINVATQNNVDAFSCDIWSMGVTLYSLVVGKLPFTGDLPELFRAIQEDPFVLSQLSVVSDRC